MSKRSLQGLQNRALKLRYLDSAKQVVEQLQAENEKLKNDPDTVVGQVIPQLRTAISQNKKLSVLAAAIIEAAGGSIAVSKATLESFESKVLSIKWAVPEGVESVDAATELIFSYEALTQEEVDARQAAATPPQVTVTPEPESPTEPISISLGQFQKVAEEAEEVTVPPSELDREQKAEEFIKASGKAVHTNDCSTSIAPAEEPGPCDCDCDQSENAALSLDT
jgi:hypothetical protein